MKLFMWLLYSAATFIGYRTKFCYQSQQIDSKWGCTTLFKTKIWCVLLYLQEKLEENVFPLLNVKLLCFDANF